MPLIMRPPRRRFVAAGHPPGIGYAVPERPVITADPISQNGPRSPR
jgi:hypothetical protein